METLAGVVPDSRLCPLPSYLCLIFVLLPLYSPFNSIFSFPLISPSLLISLAFLLPFLCTPPLFLRLALYPSCGFIRNY